MIAQRLSVSKSTYLDANVILYSVTFSHTRGVDQVYVVYTEGTDSDTGLFFLTKLAAELSLQDQTIYLDKPSPSINKVKGKTMEQMLAFFER